MPWKGISCLRTLQSGLLATETLRESLDMAKRKGEDKIKGIIKHRLQSNEILLHKTIKQTKQMTFADIVAPPSPTMAIPSVAKEDIEEALNKNAAIMELPLTKVPLSLFNVNGTLRKTTKSKLQDCLDFKEVTDAQNTLVIIDMGYIWRLATPSKEEREKRTEHITHWVTMLKRF